MALRLDPTPHFHSLRRESANLFPAQAMLWAGDEHVLITVDTLNVGVHFGADDDPEGIGHKTLAVNLSDLAAMGAQARWVSLALRLPADTTEAWLRHFAAGFDALAARYDVTLCALSVAEGPLSATVEALGTAPAGAALRREGARLGHRIFVSGTLGDAAWALRSRLAQKEVGEPAQQWLGQRLDRPEPRLELGAALRGLASSAIDLSDGLCADLSHVLQASAVGASLEAARLPLSAALRQCAGAEAVSCALAGGDDYELCFTVPLEYRDAVRSRARQLGLAVTEVGQIESQSGLRVRQADGRVADVAELGYEHFKT